MHAEWESVIHFIVAFDLCCTDVAKEKFELSEPEYRHLVNKFDADTFFSSEEMQKLFKDMYQ